MLYRSLGQTGEKVSILGFGAMRLPVLDGHHDTIDLPLATEMVRYVIDHVVNYVDTAYPYHGTSTAMGQGHSGLQPWVTASRSRRSWSRGATHQTRDGGVDREHH